MKIISYRKEYINDKNAISIVMSLGEKCTRYNLIKYYDKHFIKEGYKVINTTLKPYPSLILMKDNKLIAVEIEKTKKASYNRLLKVHKVYKDIGFDYLIYIYYTLHKNVLLNLNDDQLNNMIKKLENKKLYYDTKKRIGMIKFK